MFSLPFHSHQSYCCLSSFGCVGVLYRDAGNISLAVEAYEQCLKIDPDSRNAGQVKKFNLVPSWISFYFLKLVLQWAAILLLLSCLLHIGCLFLCHPCAVYKASHRKCKRL